MLQPDNDVGCSLVKWKKELEAAVAAAEPEPAGAGRGRCPPGWIQYLAFGAGADSTGSVVAVMFTPLGVEIVRALACSSRLDYLPWMAHSSYLCFCLAVMHNTRPLFMCEQDLALHNGVLEGVADLAGIGGG